MANKRKVAANYTIYTRQCSENIRAIINEYKARRKLTDGVIAESINMPLPTFRIRKKDPSSFRIRELWMIYEILDVPEEQRKTII